MSLSTSSPEELNTGEESRPKPWEGHGLVQGTWCSRCIWLRMEEKEADRGLQRLYENKDKFRDPNDKANPP